MRRAHLDTGQGIPGDLDLLVEAGDLAAHVGEVFARFFTRLLRGL